MRTNALAAVGLAALLVLAGCAGSTNPAGGDDGGGTVNVYISDQQNAIDDFEHLNVTITKVGAVPADNDTEPVEREVDSFTVDLTKLQGKNATLLEEMDAPNGTYEQVYVEVSDVEGTLKSGEEADVKLPSQKLRVNKEFTVGNGESVDFVFDITVVKAGGSGMYNIKPVAGESGTDVEFEERDVGDREDDGDGDDGDTATETEGSVALYLSDEKNAIDDFEHVNVTVTKVGVHRTGDGGGEWIEKDVDNRTYDITTLLGANASKLDVVGAPNGTYDKVFIYVDGIDATLKGGEEVNVKLPSNKLQVNKEFTVGDGEQVEFVFDISVFKAGNSGKYILKPVISESGTDVPMNKTDEDADEAEADGADESDDADEANETEAAGAPLNLSLAGEVAAGETVTLTVTADGEPVANATVAVNGETVGETGADGTLTVTVPSDAEELELEVVAGDREAELTREIAAGTEAGGGEGGNGDDYAVGTVGLA